MDAINVRVVDFLKHTGKSKSDFASELSISPAVISHISSGRNKVGLDIVQKILQHYPAVSPYWLISGVGLMHDADNKGNTAVLEKEVKLLKAELNEVSNRLAVFKRNFTKLTDLISD
ncbi:MAG: plasmid maintenance system antidote protein VapI [Bacteroidia bacterium]|jgi:plasmid maintenance system antidote protein VapI